MERGLQTGLSNRTPRRPAKSKRAFGLKELVPGRDPEVDIVAIHGINGHREDSWTAENGVLWLKDLLPAKIPNARILTYGYDGNTYGQEHATNFMHEHAMNLISNLALFREESNTAQRPVIFVAHGSGGLLLKSALIHGHLCHEEHLKHHLANSQSTHGVAFFGTPHQGSTELAQSIFGSGSTSTPTRNVLLQHLEKDSEALQQQLVHYSAISGRFETKFFYETYDTDIAGVPTKVVPRSSAVVPGAVNAEAIGIHKDHEKMVKFPSKDDQDFWTVSTTLSLMSKAACQKIKKTVLTPSQERALSSLRRVNTARLDASSRPRCLEGTREDLLQKISEWTEQDISRENRRIFWLCGQAGTGKTTISSTVASGCKAKAQLGASFFFSRDHADRSDLQLVFPTIAYQLGVFHKPFKKSLAEVLEQDPDLVEMDPMYQFETLIMKPIKSCGSFPASTIVVIDALDECKDEDPISRMLAILSSRIHQLSCLKFFITSRPEDHIRGGFDPLSDVTETVILHNLEVSVVDADIERYLRNVLSTTAPRLYPALLEPGWISDESIKSLVGKSGRLFIFAATALNFILDRDYSDPPSQLAILLGQSSTIETSYSSPFAFLDQLYLQVLRQAFPSTTPPHRLALLRRLLGAIVLLRDPLSPGALKILLSLTPGKARTTFRHLHSVIVIPATDEQPIRLIHPSFFDFATSRCLDAKFRIDSSECHDQLAIACFKQMKGLKRDICQIQDASKLNSEIGDLVDRIAQYIPPAMQYACRHWPFHFCISAGNGHQEMLADFCHEQVLYWIEALSLLGYLREGIRHLQDLSKYLNKFSVPSKDLLEVISEVTQFIVDHFDVISCSSLQLYRSALPLAASSSFLRKVFHRELDGGMRVLRGEWAQKSSGVTILRGATGDVKSTNFSPDGTLIVFASSGGEVRLWDRGTSTLLRKLHTEPNLFLIWARFSLDGSRVIVGTTTGIISIWDVVTGACLGTIRLLGVDPGSDFRCYDITPDFTRIISSIASNIYMWNASNGNLLKTFTSHSHRVDFLAFSPTHSHSNRVNFLAFSPDHKLITSASDDRTICIWNAVDCTRLRTLRGHSDWVMTIAFSPNSKFLVSGSRDKDIRLWDATRRVALKIMKGHTRLVYSVAFSPNGERVISGSLDHTLRVWNAISGELLKTIRYSGWVDNASFSPDGTQYISSTSETIYILDAGETASNLIELEEWKFAGVRFSPNGGYITGEIRSRKTQHVWDGLTGTHVITLDSEFPITISPNNRYLVSSPNGSDVSLWDIASKTILWRTSTHKQKVISITFSSDNTRILLGLLFGLQIFDVANGNNLFTIRPPQYSGSSPLFSDDGSQVLSEYGKHDIPPHARPHHVPFVNESSEHLKYSIEDEWIFAWNGIEKERCVWIPQDWRLDRFSRNNYSSSQGRVAIGTRRGLVLLDLSGITLSI